MTSRTVFERVGRRLEGPLLIGRAGAGLVMLAVPGVVADVWLGSRSHRSRTFVRAVGVRDLVICAGQLRVRPHTNARWRQVGGVSDLFDAAIALDRAVIQRRLASAAIAVPALASVLLSLTHQTASRAAASNETTGTK